MKRYLLADDFGNVYKNDVKGLKAILIDEISRDTIENNEDKDIVKNNMEIIKKLAKEDKINVGYLKEQLSYFGWYILDMQSLYEDLNTFQSFKNGIGCPIIPIDCIEETLNMIQKEMN